MVSSVRIGLKFFRFSLYTMRLQKAMNQPITNRHEGEFLIGFRDAGGYTVILERIELRFKFRRNKMKSFD